MTRCFFFFFQEIYKPYIECVYIYIYNAMPHLDAGLVCIF